MQFASQKTAANGGVTPVDNSVGRWTLPWAGRHNQPLWKRLVAGFNTTLSSATQSRHQTIASHQGAPDHVTAAAGALVDGKSANTSVVASPSCGRWLRRIKRGCLNIVVRNVTDVCLHGTPRRNALR
jgi:hypothetical protein